MIHIPNTEPTFNETLFPWEEGKINYIVDYLNSSLKLWGKYQVDVAQCFLPTICSSERIWKLGSRIKSQYSGLKQVIFSEKFKTKICLFELFIFYIVYFYVILFNNKYSIVISIHLTIRRLKFYLHRNVQWRDLTKYISQGTVHACNTLYCYKNHLCGITFSLLRPMPYSITKKGFAFKLCFHIPNTFICKWLSCNFLKLLFEP